MKIFQVLPYFPPHIGGMEFYVERLSRELVARGHEVFVFTSSEKSFSYHEKVDGVEIYRFRPLTRVYNVPIVPSLLISLLQENRPDVIHTHQYPVFFSDVSAQVSYLRNIPLVLHVHVISEPKSAFSGIVSNLYYKTIGRLPFRNARTIIVPSFAYKKLLVEMGSESKKVKVIPYSVDLDRFNPNNNGEEFRKRYNCDGSNVILSVGRLNYQKGFQYLLKAMPKILQQMPNAKLMIVGEGEEFTCLSNMVQSLGLKDSVILTGAMSQKEMSEAYVAADVFVLPSIFESFGIALIEAQAAGKPVVGTRVGGAPEALQEDETGFLVNPGDFEQLAEAIIRFLSDEKLAREMGENGKRFVKARFDVRKIVDQVTDIYAELTTNSAQAKK